MNSNFIDLLSLFEKHGVKYLVCGGYAVMAYSEPRYTKDLDIVISIHSDNLEAFRSAFSEFGFPMTDDAVEQLREPQRMIVVGRPPLRIDILNHIDGVEFESAWFRRIVKPINGVSVALLSLDDLIAAKETAGRPQDLIDVENLKLARYLQNNG